MLKRLERPEPTGGIGFASEIASQAGLSVAQVRDAHAEVCRQLGRELHRLTLSRGGLADVVAALGDARFLGPAEQSADRVLSFVFGSEARVRALHASIAQKARITQEQAERIVPRLAHIEFKQIVERSRPRLNDLFGRMPSLFQWSLGSMHADMADIIRRRCGAGPYDRKALRRNVRAVLAEAGGFSKAGAGGWYAVAALAPVRAVVRTLARSMQPSDRHA